VETVKREGFYLFVLANRLPRSGFGGVVDSPEKKGGDSLPFLIPGTLLSGFFLFPRTCRHRNAAMKDKAKGKK
jgi:hypothetical protein